MRLIKYFDEVHEIIGWIGALCILVAYALSSFGQIEAQSFTYQVLNFLGAFGLVFNAFKNKAYPSFILNIIWMGIGAYALWQIFLVYMN